MVREWADSAIRLQLGLDAGICSDVNLLNMLVEGGLALAAILHPLRCSSWLANCVEARLFWLGPPNVRRRKQIDICFGRSSANTAFRVRNSRGW